MSRSLILAEQFTDTAVGKALREHREDRAALLASLTASWQGDARIRAALLWGPYLRQYAEQTGSLILGLDTPRYAPPGGGYMSFLHEGRHGLLQVDCYWQPQSTVTNGSECMILFNRQTEAYAGQKYPRLDPPEEAQGLQAEVEDGLNFAWFMFLITAKYLARDAAFDLGLMFYPKPGLEEAAVRLGQAGLLTPEDWAVPELPREKVARLRHLVNKTDQLRRTANAQGCAFSSLYTSCLFRYLDMVEGILK